MLDSKAEILDAQADSIRKELGLSPGYYGSRETPGSSLTTIQATVVKLTQMEKSAGDPFPWVFIARVFDRFRNKNVF